MQEIKDPDKNAQIVAEGIASALEKGFLQAGHETSYISRNESRCSGR